MKKFLTKGLLPVLILAGGVAAGAWFFINPEEANKRPRPEAQALLVETARPEIGDYAAHVEAMGQVVPAGQAAVKPQVGGEIVETAAEYVPGGYFRQGEEILKIDPADYELIVQKQQAVLQQAQADHALEMGRQSVAKDELEILQRTTGRKPENTSLVLRRPQLEQAQAELAKAKADLETAKLNLQRTVLSAPFNALVIERQATLGDRVTAGQTLATLVNTDEYWIEISVPVNDLRWVVVPRQNEGQGSEARIILDGGRGERQGYVARLSGALDPDSRLATLLVSVPDPLLLQENGAANAPRLLLSDYARVVVEGRELKNVARIPLGWLHDNNTVWVMEDGMLMFRPVEVVYEDRQYAYVANGLTAETVIVTSDIAVPVERMKIRTMEADAQPQQAEEAHTE